MAAASLPGAVIDRGKNHVMTAFDDFRDYSEKQSFFHDVIPSKAAAYGQWPPGLHSDLLAGLAKCNAGTPYQHQADTVVAALASQDVALVTGTASGKTIAFLAPAFQQMMTDPNATALLIYPTKALAWDQFDSATKLRDAIGPSAQGISIEKYDGDTASEEKKRIRAGKPNFVLTNPDELHIGILNNHKAWRGFLTNLRYVIIDEVHAYSGYFGSNVSLVLRRLRAVCQIHGSNPTFIAASATVNNAQQHVEAHIGKTVKVVDIDSADKAEKHIQFINPGMKKIAPENVTVGLITQLVWHGLQGIVFTNSRQQAEKLAELARSGLAGDDQNKVTAYRGGYWHRDRQKIEKGLKKGTILVVVSTNALELGIDIGRLNVCILHGLPPTNSEAWQRLGRVGRKKDHNALGIIVGTGSVLESVVFRDPAAFIAARNQPEFVVINPENPKLLQQHLACSAFETAGNPTDVSMFPNNASMLLPQALSEYQKGKPYKTYHAVDIRFIRKSHHIYLQGREDPLGEIDGNVAHREAHYRAVYLHGGERYRIEKWLPSNRGTIGKHISCKIEADNSVYTTPNLEIQINSLELDGHFLLGNQKYQIGIISGEFDVSEMTVGYYEHFTLPGQEQTKARSLKYPKGIKLVSRGIAITIASDTQKVMLEKGEGSPVYILHSLGHLLVSVLMKSGNFGRSDVLEFADGYVQQFDSPALFLYEAFPHGLGYTKAIFNDPVPLLNEACARVLSCRCPDGCSNCLILKGRCAQHDSLLDKKEVTRFLQNLLAGKTVRTPWTPPAEPPWPLRGSTWNIGDSYENCGTVVDVDRQLGVTIERPSGQMLILPWQDDEGKKDDAASG
jgi:DEAD/DEAH box helicase domain-containing protein